MAKFTDCADLPEPLDTQAVRKSTNRFGCFYSLNPDAHRDRTERGNPFWDDYFNTSIRGERRRLLAQLGLAWNNKLSASQRAAWHSLAGSVTWTTYKGVNTTGNGFELYMAVQTERRYTFGVPWFSFAFPTWPIFLDPPGAWDPPAAPALGTPSVAFDAWLSIPVTNAPANSDWWSAAPYIKKGTTRAGTTFRPYYVARDFLSDFGSDPPVLYVPIDFPIRNLDRLGPATVGYRFLNLNTGVFSDPSWVNFT